MKIYLIVAITVLIFFNIQYTQAEQTSISGHNSEMTVFVYFDNHSNIIKLITEDGTQEFFNTKLKQYPSGSFSLKSAESGIGLWAHLLENGQYKITVLTYLEEARIIQKIIGTVIVSEETRTITGQRDLGSEVVPTQENHDNKTPKERMLYEKQQRVEQAEELYQKKIEDIKNSKSSKEILKEANDAKIQTGMGLVKPNKAEIIKTPTVNSSDLFTIQAFADIAPRVHQQQNLKISVLVTDDTKSNTHDKFGWIGLGINDAAITGLITDPQGKIANVFQGESSDKGIFETQYLVPTNSPTRGEYTILITVTKDTSQPVILSDTFFVMETDKSGSFDNPPIANAGKDQIVGEHENNYVNSTLIYTEIKLDGTASVDPDSPMTYFWKQINGTMMPLNDNTSPTPWFNATNMISTPIVDKNNTIIDLINSTTIQFDLTVTSKSKSDVDSVFVTIEYVRETLYEPIVKQIGELLE